MGCSQWVGWMVRARKEHDWKIDEKDVWGRCMLRDLRQWEKDVKILVSRVNAHQGMTSAEEELSNLIYRMTHSVDRQPLCHTFPVIAQ